MCFIKTVYKPLQSFDPLIFTYDNQQTLKVPFFINETLTQLLPSPFKFPINQRENGLQSLLSNWMKASLKDNTVSLQKINEKISGCDHQVDDLLKLLQESEDQQIGSQNDKKLVEFEIHSSVEQIELRQEQSQNPLTKQLFGNGKYKYKLSLEEEFGKVIYKERNIKLNVGLTSINGSVIKNANVVNLCLGLADDNGNWINMNRVSDPMLKGKTEVQLYHGKAEFNKIYTKDISRTFPNGRLNIVIYAKPSILIYDGLTSEYEEHVDPQNLQPLIIEGVIIKAKKKY